MIVWLICQDSNVIIICMEINIAKHIGGGSTYLPLKQVAIKPETTEPDSEFLKT